MSQNFTTCSVWCFRVFPASHPRLAWGLQWNVTHFQLRNIFVVLTQTHLHLPPHCTSSTSLHIFRIRIQCFYCTLLEPGKPNFHGSPNHHPFLFHSNYPPWSLLPQPFNHISPIPPQLVCRNLSTMGMITTSLSSSVPHRPTHSKNGRNAQLMCSEWTSNYHVQFVCIRLRICWQYNAALM